jgi:hypothetical protein
MKENFSLMSTKGFRKSEFNMSTLSGYSDKSKDLKSVLKRTELTKHKFFNSIKKMERVEEEKYLEPRLSLRKPTVIKKEEIIAYKYRSTITN